MEKDKSGRERELFLKLFLWHSWELKNEAHVPLSGKSELDVRAADPALALHQHH